MADACVVIEDPKVKLSRDSGAASKVVRIQSETPRRAAADASLVRAARSTVPASFGGATFDRSPSDCTSCLRCSSSSMLSIERKASSSSRSRAMS